MGISSNADSGKILRNIDINIYISIQVLFSHYRPRVYVASVFEHKTCHSDLVPGTYALMSLVMLGCGHWQTQLATSSEIVRVP